MKISRRETSSVGPCNLVVAQLTWRLLDFLVFMAACGLLGVLVTVATSIVLIVLAIVVLLRVGSSSSGATSLGDGACVML
jgi:hypothetical protein